jgi:hypothetical protein
VPGAKHKPFSTIKTAAIPVNAISALTAQALAQHLGGQLAPATWTTKIQPAIRVGGVERAHFVLKSRRFFGPMWNVIATMTGAVAPQQSVIVGGHRDAWTWGTLDPGSGTVAMLQLGAEYGKLKKAGWHPYRTVMIASWDGEETNDFGSGIWVDQYKEQLLHTCVAYINTDEIATGATYLPYATDDLDGLMRSVADSAVAPDGKTVNEYWTKQDPKRAISPPGTGSDHESFVYHLNIPAAGLDYASVFGTYHSAYEDLASLKIFDPQMQYQDAAARLYGLMVLRLADAPYPDIRLNADAQAMQRRLNAFANGRGHEHRRATVAHAMQPYLDRFARQTASIDGAADQYAQNGDLAALKNLLALSIQIRQAFYSPRGIPGYGWQGSVLYNSDDNISTLPSLEATLDPKHGDAALKQILACFQRLPPMLVVSR